MITVFSEISTYFSIKVHLVQHVQIAFTSKKIWISTVHNMTLSERLYVAQMCGTILLRAFPHFEWPYPLILPWDYKRLTPIHILYFFIFQALHTEYIYAIPWQNYNTGNQYHYSAYKVPYTLSLVKVLILRIQPAVSGSW